MLELELSVRSVRFVAEVIPKDPIDTLSSVLTMVDSCRSSLGFCKDTEKMTEDMSKQSTISEKV